MPSRDFPAEVLVLRKTKLGESDLILTLLSADGSLLRAVAKGARKPRSPFASRLELFSCARLLLHEGKNLHVVTEARLVEANAALRANMELSLIASVVAELMTRLAQEGLENDRFFPLTKSAFDQLCLMRDANESSDALPESNQRLGLALAEIEGSASVCASDALALCAAFLLKALAFAGLRPSLDRCASCGEPLLLARESWFAFSAVEGGALCPACRANYQHSLVKGGQLQLMATLLFIRFSDIRSFPAAKEQLFELLRLLQGMITQHVGANLKSLEVLYSCWK